MTRPGAGDSGLERWGRRALTIPGYALALVLLLAVLPLALPLAVLLDVATGRRLARTRTLLFAVHYLSCEILGLVASLVLFALHAIRRSPEKDRKLHYALQSVWAALLFGGLRRLFGVRLEVSGRDAVPAGPALVFFRHASVADTLLPAALLSQPGGLRLRYVLKRELLWDPCLDVVGNRLPNLFVRRDSRESAAEIAKVSQLAANLGSGEGVLIYPEGTRFSEARRERALDRIARSGDAKRLERARSLRNVLPPRTGGPLALLDACAGADVLLVAHVGFEGISHFRDAWGGGLIGRHIRVQLWCEPSASIPRSRAARVEWLFDAWQRIDAWIDAQRAAAEGTP